MSEETILINSPEPEERETPPASEEIPDWKTELRQEMEKARAQLEEQLSAQSDIKDVGSILEIFQKTAQFQQQNLELVIQRVDNLAKLHQDQTAEQVALMEEMERLIKIQLDQIEEHQNYLDKMALLIAGLQNLEKNLREDLQEAEAQNEEG